MKRRTKARLELCGAVLVLLVAPYIRKYRDGEKRPLSPSGVAVGAVSQIVRLRAQDLDFAGIRTRRSRRVLAHLAWSGVTFAHQRLWSDPQTADDHFYTGTSVGTVLYRLWYGLLRPVPGSDE